MTDLDGATRNPLSSATPMEPVPVSTKGFNRAYDSVQRSIRRNWTMVRVYRELTDLERREGNEIAARRWISYRAATLRDIRMLRDAVR